MCGIFGLISLGSAGQNGKDLIQGVVNGLKKLEYRGYDSAGIGFTLPGNNDSQNLQIIKCAGKIKKLEAFCKKEGLFAKSPLVCIGHTRWATHGEPSQNNSHPIRSFNIESSEFDGNFCIVMNGIIENFSSLKKELEKEGYNFQTDTDTEVVCNLIQKYYNELRQNIPHSEDCIKKAIVKSLDLLEGSFAYIVISDISKKIYCIRKGAPMIIGKSSTCFSIASDTIALSENADQIHNLKDGTVISIDHFGNAVCIFDAQISKNTANDNDLDNIVVEFEGLTKSLYEYDKGKFAHFMLKEINESSTVLKRLLNIYAKDFEPSNLLKDLEDKIFEAQEIVIVGCGTSYNAGFAIKYIIEKYAKIRCSVHIASEFRHQPLMFDKESLFIFISQSGETADTLGALEYVKSNKFKTIAFVNVLESTIARQADHLVSIMAGPEIGVASTKAFIAQYTCLLLFALRMAKYRNKMSDDEIGEILHELKNVEVLIQDFLCDQKIPEIAKKLAEASMILFIGRNVSFPMAMEGALKFKEITYKPSEGLPAGELKHGPIALIDKNSFVVAINPEDDLNAKTTSNIHEVKSRKAQVLMISTEDCIEQNRNIIDFGIPVAHVSDLVSPLLYAVPLQLVSYYAASYLELEIDQPRNLAKSVTVE